jgi:hypothetical protein
VGDESEHTGDTSGTAVIVRCAWCERIKVDGEWVDTAEVQAMRKPPAERPHSHGICPDCLAQLTP